MNPKFIMNTKPQAKKPYPANDEYFIKLSNGYMAILHVYDFPIYPSHFWCDALLQRGVDLTIGYRKSNKTTALKNIGKSITELNLQPAYDSSGTAGQNSVNQISDLQDMFQLVERNGETIADMFITLQLFDLDPFILLEKVRAIQMELQSKQFEVSFKLFENKMMLDFNSYVNPQRPIEKYGKQLPLTTLIKGLTYRQQSFVDMVAGSDFLGYSFSNGIVQVNTWLQSSTRLSYDKFYVGKKGSGKSTAMKLDIINNFKRKVRQFILDGENEYGVTTEYLGGKNVQLDKETLNALQIFDNWVSHLSKLQTLLEMLFPHEDARNIDQLKQIITTVYKKNYGFDESTNFLELRNAEFPTFTEVLDYTRQLLYVKYTGNIEEDIFKDSIHPSQLEGYIASERMLVRFVEEEYRVFNGITTFDIDNENLINFNIAEVLEWGKELKQSVYYLITNLIWKQVSKNRTLKHLGHKIKKIAIYLDECHHLLNSNNISILEFVEKMLRRARKYLAALIFATQKLKDLIPSGAGEIVDKIKTIFSLVEYKFLMQIDEMDMELVEQFLPKVTDVERNLIGSFEEYGDCLLSVGKHNIAFRFLLQDVYKELMDGHLVA